MHQSMLTLSGGQKQLVAIAGCLAAHAPLLILDEPTSMLDPDAADLVLEKVRELNRNGTTIIWVTQKLSEIQQGDRIIELESGSVVYDGFANNWLRNEALKGKSEIESESIEDTCPNRVDGNLMVEKETVKPATYTRSNMMDWQLQNVTTKEHNSQQSPILSHVNTSFQSGKITLLIGHNGSGKSTLLELMSGIRPIEHGLIELGDDSLWKNTKKSMNKSMKKSMKKRHRNKLNRNVTLKLGVALQSAQDQWFASTVREEFEYSMKPYHVPSEEAQVRMEQALTRVGLPKAMLERDPWSLSGGQQRRLALACLLACEPDWLLLDEPSAGMDADGIRRLCAVLEAHKAAGRGAIVATHDLEALLPIADAVVVVSGGTVCEAQTWPAQPASNREAAAAIAGGLARTRQPLKSESREKNDSKEAFPADRFDPRALILCYMLLAMSILAQHTIVQLCLGAFIVILLVVPIRQLILPWIRIIRAYAVMIALFCLVSGISLHPLSYEWASAEPVFIRFSKLLIIMLIGMPLLQLMTPMRLQRAIQQTFGWLTRLQGSIHSFALLITLIFRFIPLLTREWERFAKLVHARGKSTAPIQSVPIKHARSMLIPYMRAILRLAEQMSDALEARGFGYARSKPVYGFRLQFSRADAHLFTIAIIVSLLLISIAVMV